MSDKFFVGLDVTGFENNGQYKPISRVTLMVDDNNAITAGDDTGSEVVADCPHATQEMVDNLLSSLKGYQYQAYSADAANLDPSAELGDGVTVGGVYSMVSRLDDDGSGYYGISAPGEEELEDEYPSSGPMTQAFNRQIAETKSLITKTSEEIKLAIYGGTDADGNEQQSIIDQKLDSIELSVSNRGTTSTITLKVGETEISSDDIKITGVVTFSGLKSGTTKIDGGWIETNTVTASQIDVSTLYVGTGGIRLASSATISWDQVTGTDDVATTDDIPTKTSELKNDSNYTTLENVENQGYQTKAQVTQITKDTITTTYVNALDVTAANLKGGSISLLNAAGKEAGSITLSSAVTAEYAVDISAGSGGLRIMSGGSSAIYVEAGGGGKMMIYNGNTTFTGSIKPNNDGKTYCGTSDNKWAAVYAATGTIQTSDANAKHDVEALPEKYLNFLKDLPAYRFKMNENTSDRYHVGYIAQEVEMLMENHGIDSTEFGGFCKAKDADGNDIYMLRYEEFIAIHTAAIQDIYKRLEALALT